MIISTLRAKYLCKILYPFLTVAIVEEIKRYKCLKPTSLSPSKELYFFVAEKLVIVLHNAVYYARNALVARAFVIYGKRFCYKYNSPSVVFCALVVLARTDPTIGLLALKNAVYIGFCNRNKIFVL